MSRKIERLINLTIALLATKRYLTKNEIFRSVDGYEGADEAKERMFERDKDDLRNLGVEIEVGSFDPVFEDEAGYRIKPESYVLNLGEITGAQVALLSLAAEAWRGAALDDEAHRALNKLLSMGIESDMDSLPVIAPRLFSTHNDFQVIAHSITKRKRLSFTYLNLDLQGESRTIEPYAIASRNALWYLSGWDVTKKALRTFRLDRIDGEIVAAKDENAYVIPEGFDVFDHLDPVFLGKTATIRVRKGKAQLLRSSSVTMVDSGDWDLITVDYADASQLIDLILWHGEDALVEKPEDLRDEIISRLRQVVEIHG